MFLPMSMQKSPRMVPGLELRGLVSPNIFRPVRTTPLPSQTIATTGPDFMYWMSPAKNPFWDRSAQCSFKRSSEGSICLRATKKYPFFSNLLMISPTSPLCTPSGLTIMKVLSIVDKIFIIFHHNNTFIYNPMGNNCQTCSPANDALEIDGITFPSPEFARPEPCSFEIPCNVNHIVTALPPLRSQNDDQGGFPLDSCFYLIRHDVYYRGDWKKGLPHGKGQVTFRNGCIMKGNFKRGVANGSDNVFIMGTGAYYRGCIRDNQFEGEGKLIEPNGHEYDGHWHENLPHGQGTEKFINGDLFQGTFYKGKKEGHQCKYTWKNSKQFSFYEGSYKNDYFCGKGRLVKQDGTEIVGEFSDDNVKQATVTNNKYKYKGEVLEGQLEGNGEIEFVDLGVTYKGQFSNGQPNGRGVMKEKDGRQKEGRWVKGRYIENSEGFSNEEILDIHRKVDKLVYSQQTLEDLIQGLNSEFQTNNRPYRASKERNTSHLRFFNIDVCGNLILISY